MEPLYGRDEILSSARRWLDRTCAGDGKLLLFTGEPGIGKSRLAEQVAADAASRGVAVAWGRSWEAGGAPAYWPWIQVFRSLQMEPDPFSDAPVDSAVGAPEARFAAFDQAVRSLRARAAQKPLVLVLDDLHAADPPSLLLLLLLARELARSSILVIGAYREAELRLTPELSALLAKLTREAEVVPLTRLAPDDVGQWLRDVHAEGSDAQASELYRLTEGHPLFVLETLRLGLRSEAQATWLRGPAAVLDERLGRLSPDSRSLLEVAAVLGREFSIAEVAATADVSPDRVHAAIHEAVAIDLVVHADAIDWFRFSHVLMRDRLYAELAPSRRAALHFQAGTSSLARTRDAQAAVHHLFEGQTAGSSELIAEVALAAAEAALARLAFEDAARLCRRALELPAADPLPALLQGRLQVVEAEARIRLGDAAESKRLCIEAAACAERTGSHELLARAALVYGTELQSGMIDPQMISLLRRGLAALPDEHDSALRSRLMARLAAALTPPRDFTDGPEILALIRDSTAMARRIGDRHALLYVLQFAATVGLLVPEHERLAVMEETLRLARALEQPLVLLHALPAYLTALIASGDARRAESLLPEYVELLQRTSHPLHRLRHLLVSALLSALRGDFDEAERLGSEAHLLSQQGVGSPMTWLVHRLSIAHLRQQPQLMASAAPMLLAHRDWSPAALPHAAWMLIGLGRHEEASALVREPAVALTAIPSSNLWCLHGQADACVLLEDIELGERLYPVFERAADRMFWNIAPGAIIGPSQRALGDLALLIGRVPEAVRHYDEAIAFCLKLGAPALLENCRQKRALALARLTPAAPADPETRAAGTPARSSQLQLHREGELWAIHKEGAGAVRLKHVKGLTYLEYLIAHPGREVHVLELVGIEHRPGDAGPVLDARAKAAYRDRLEALHDELGEAERFDDRTRAARAQQEIDAIAEQLAGAVGLGGRDRQAASDVERTRINVQRRLKDALDRIGAVDPALGRYLAATVKTGTTCVYQPF